MKFVLFLLVICLTQQFVSTSAAEETDGNQFLRACSAGIKDDGVRLSEREAANSLWCFGYIQGFIDSIALTQSLSGSPKRLCLPERGIVNDQAARIFVKYLRENPERLHESGRVSLYLALKKVFPCK